MYNWIFGIFPFLFCQFLPNGGLEKKLVYEAGNYSVSEMHVGSISLNTGTQTASGIQVSSTSMSYLTDLEKAVVRELNAVRSNPQGYAKHIKARLKYYNGNRYEYPGQTVLMTMEGASAAQECYEFLMKASPIDTLKPSKGMSLAARDHVEDQGPTGKTGHNGRDGSSPFDRIERYGKWLKIAGENIDYGNDNAREIVIALLIDDGVPSRGHRNNIFNPDFKVVGVACGYHAKYRAMCVMTFAGGFKRNADTRLRTMDSEEE